MEMNDANTNADDGTPMNQNQFGHVFTLETSYDGTLAIQERFNDGSTARFVLDDSYTYSTANPGTDDSMIMLKKEFSDGSTRTLRVPAQWFDSIRGGLKGCF